MRQADVSLPPVALDRSLATSATDESMEDFTSAAAPANATGKRKVLICLLRLDLRVHDNALWHL